MKPSAPVARKNTIYRVKKDCCKAPPCTSELYGGQFAHHRAALHGLDDQQLYSREAVPALINYLSRELSVGFISPPWCATSNPARCTPLPAPFAASRSLSAPVTTTRRCWPSRLPNSTRKSAACKCCARPAVALNLQHALLTGLSCVHYSAFADLPEAAPVQAEIPAGRATPA